MYQPEQYGIALLFMICTMICWGSWANTLKLAPGWPFQLFYWDYVLGVVAGSLLWGFTLGNLHPDGNAFLANLVSADRTHILYAIVAGIVFNIANLLLVAAIDIAGLAVAFPLGIGLALVVGVILNYILAPKANPLLLTIGVALVVIAILLDAYAYRRRETTGRAISVKGIQISIGCGILMGLFYPLVAKAADGPRSLGPYTVVFCFSVGVFLCSLPANTLLMRRPIVAGRTSSFSEYFQGKLAWHFWGVTGGVIWCTGMVFNLVASKTNIVGPAVSYAIGQGATMVSAIWGVFIWREFADAPAQAKKAIPWMFVFFLIGLAIIAIAPVVRIP